MRRTWKNYHTGISLTDLLFNLLLGFICLTILSFLLINLESKKANIETKAEIIVTLSWEATNIDDVDLWIRDPAGNVLFFRKKEVGLMHLDRDDLGSQNDTFVTADGSTATYNFNQEIGTIRGVMAGEWVVNAQMYNKKDARPCKVSVKIEKLNPSVKIIKFKEFVMTEKGEEVTIARITTSGEGDVLSVDETPAKLTEQHLLYNTERGDG